MSLASVFPHMSDDALPLLDLIVRSRAFGRARQVVSARKRALAVGGLLLFVAALGGFRFFSRAYTASAAFSATTRKSSGALTGLAAQVGLSLGATEPQSSPQYFADVLRSAEVLRRVSARRFHARPLGLGTSTLDSIWSISDADTVRARERMVERLNNDVTVVASTRTGIVTFEVRTRDPLLSEDLAAALLSELDGFNRDTRNSQAAAERRFTEARLADATKELRDAEDQLEGFLRQNRMFQNAPELVFHRDRLARDVSTKQDVVNLLSQSYEQAKIEEVRDTPAITVLELPRRPARADSSSWAVCAAEAVAVTGVTILLWVVAYASRDERRGSDSVST
jgi:uncharacterized protein involved in exopolysaccharide biosynthesis